MKTISLIITSPIVYGLIVFMFIIGCQHHANAQSVTNSAIALTNSTAADWAKALGDLGFHVSPEQISLAFLIGLPFIKSLAGYLRKAIPKQAQVNKAGILLAHVAGIDNPTLASQAAEIPALNLAASPAPTAVKTP